MGRRIKAARQAASLTQHGLAKQLDVTDAQISRWENGHAMPGPETLEAIAAALGVEAESFFLERVSG